MSAIIDIYIEIVDKRINRQCKNVHKFIHRLWKNNYTHRDKNNDSYIIITKQNQTINGF
jgi:hypothetical protein